MKNTVGTKNYNGQDWFWPHDYRHYLRDANARQRKLIHNGWLKIGVPVKKSGLKISDRYLEPKKNQLKKAWAIVRKVVAPKELGMPIPESVKEAKYKGYDYKRQNRKDGLPLIVPALQKTFSNMKDLKKYIDKHGTMESVNEFKYNLYQKLPDKQKVMVHLISKGNKASDAKKMVNKYYDKVSKAYKKASLSKKAEIISVMSAKNEGSCGYGVDGKLGNEPAGPKLLKKKKKFDLDEACQKGYMTHPTRKTKVMFGKRYRNCVKKEGVDTRVTEEQAGKIFDNLCVNCGDFTNENLRKWFSDRWVNIGKKKKGGGHPPCGSSGKKRGYAKCVPASKAAGMTKKQKASATRRKRAAQNKRGRGGTSSLKGGGKKPIYVSTKPKK